MKQLPKGRKTLKIVAQMLIVMIIIIIIMKVINLQLLKKYKALLFKTILPYYMCCFKGAEICWLEIDSLNVIKNWRWKLYEPKYEQIKDVVGTLSQHEFILCWRTFFQVFCHLSSVFNRYSVRVSRDKQRPW